MGYIADTSLFSVGCARRGRQDVGPPAHQEKVDPVNKRDSIQGCDTPSAVASSLGSVLPGLTRRQCLAWLGLGGAAAFLASCGEPSANHIVTDLPDPLAPAPFRGGLAEKELAPPTPTRPLPPPATVTPPQNHGILPRSAWAKAGPDLARVDAMNGVRLITFHHSGDPKAFTTTDYAETAQHLEYVREYHRSRSFQDIGYHFAIDRAGRVWQLRSLKYQGQHVRSNNEHNIGVVVLGNFKMQAPTAAQKEKVKVFAQLLRKQYGLPISRLYTHQEIVKTECPGDLQPYFAGLRKQGLL